MTRYIVLDTETTGLSPEAGHRLVEIGCIELHDMSPTMNTFHSYINPQRNMPAQAQAVHGLSEEFLLQFPTFSEIAHKLWAFLDGATLIIHNATFDMSFINHEFKKLNFSTLPNDVIDTLKLARELYPGKRASLDSLCARFNISLNERESKGHGALLDAKLLTQVYLEMITNDVAKELSVKDNVGATAKQEAFGSTLELSCSDEEDNNHAVFCQKLSE